MKRTRTRLVEGAKTSNWLNKKGTISRQAFSSEASSVKMDDPNFWQKVMPDLISIDLMVNNLKDFEMDTKEAENAEKRRRKQEKAGAAGVPLGEVGTNPTNPTTPLNPNPVKEELASSNKKKGPGRPPQEKFSDDEDYDEDDEGPEDKRTDTVKATADKFISDLAKVVEDLRQKIEAGTVTREEKETARDLLLKIIPKKKLFSLGEIERARGMVLLLEDARSGDRKSVV